jgi:ArsR family transcriptional regulator
MNLEKKIDKIRSLFTSPRIEILDHLSNGESCVCEMVESLAMKHNLLSYHLGVLVDEGILQNSRKGRHIRYEINPDRFECVEKIFNLLKSVDCD